MDEREEALRHAADRVKDGERAKTDLRALIPDLVKSKTMVELAEMTGIPRTTLYHIVWGKAGKRAA